MLLNNGNATNWTAQGAYKTPTTAEIIAAVKRLVTGVPEGWPNVFAYRGTFDEFKAELVRVGVEVMTNWPHEDGPPRPLLWIEGYEIRQIGEFTVCGEPAILARMDGGELLMLSAAIAKQEDKFMGYRIDPPPRKMAWPHSLAPFYA
jgi:hypothetical protein